MALDESDSSSLTTYSFSTSDGTLGMCPGEVTYNPKWYQFNIESLGAPEGNYALYTQVAGTPFNLQVASYKKDADGNYTKRTSYKGSMEVELFEIPSFQSLGSYGKYNFDRICEDSSNKKPWGGMAKSILLHLMAQKQHPLA